MHRSSVARAAVVVCVLACLTQYQPQAYNAYGWKWATRQVDYYVNPANLDVSPEAAVAAVQYGASAWSAQTNADFSFYFAGYTNGTTVSNNGKNEVFFRNGSKDTAIATTYYWYSGTRALDADIVFWDATYTFFTGSSSCSGGFYIEDVAAHEFGHALGLGHSSVADATMVSGTKYCGTYKRTLEADDKNGVEFLYPPAGTQNPPSVTISTPSSGSTFSSGTSITFSGSAQDSEDGALSAQIAWSSNISGALGTGSTITKTLTSGTHTIKASVTDSGGANASAQVTVTVAADNAAPTVAISSPSNGASFTTATSITFSGSAQDTEDGNLASNIAWSSNLSGALGTGGSLTKSLPAGNHTITATVTDSKGATASAQASISVTTSNGAPTVTISSPAIGSTFDTSTTITFSGTAQDAEDGTLTSKLVWSSSLSGPLGMGGTLQKTLTAGTHTITANVSDSGGLTTTSSVGIVVNTADSALSTAATLSATGYKVKGNQHVDLLWTATSWASVDVYRNGSRVARVSNTGAYTDVVNKKGNGSYTYQVCDVGTTTCSNQVSVWFN